MAQQPVLTVFFATRAKMGREQNTLHRFVILGSDFMMMVIDGLAN